MSSSRPVHALLRSLEALLSRLAENKVCFETDRQQNAERLRKRPVPCSEPIRAPRFRFGIPCHDERQTAPLACSSSRLPRKSGGQTGSSTPETETASDRAGRSTGGGWAQMAASHGQPAMIDCTQSVAASRQQSAQQHSSVPADGGTQDQRTGHVQRPARNVM